MTQKYQVKVSMKQAAIVETGIVLKQGDFGMQIEIEVLDFDATGTTPQIVFRKAMGAVESTTITVSGNKYTYTFKGTELDTPGKVFCDLKLKNSTTQRISTASFMFKVVADTMDGLTEEASSYSDTIEQIIDGYETSMDEVKIAVNGAENVEIVDFYSDSTIVTANETIDITDFHSTSGFVCAVVPCVAGDVFTISGQGGSEARLFAFCDSSGNSLPIKTDENVAINDLVISAPANSAYLIINSAKTSFHAYKGRLNRIKENKTIDILERKTNLYNYLGNTAGKYLNAQGYEYDNNNQEISDYISVEEGNLYVLTCPYNGSYNVGCCFYDSNKTRLRGSKQKNKNNGSSEYFFFTPPENAKYFRFSINIPMQKDLIDIYLCNITSREAFDLLNIVVQSDTISLNEFMTPEYGKYTGENATKESSAIIKRYNAIPIKAGDMINYISFAEDLYPIYYLDSNGAVISHSFMSAGGVTVAQFTAPENSKAVLIQGGLYIDVAITSAYAENIKEYNEVKTNKKPLYKYGREILIYKGKKINLQNGTENSAKIDMSDYIDVENLAGDSILIYLYATEIYGIFFYDQNKELLSRDAYSTTGAVNEALFIPENAKYMRIQSNIDYPFYIYSNKKIDTCMCDEIGLGEQINDGLKQTCASAVEIAYSHKYGIVSAVYLTSSSNYGEQKGNIGLSIYPAGQPGNAKYLSVSSGNQEFEPNILQIADDTVRVFFIDNTHKYYYKDVNILTYEIGEKHAVSFNSGDLSDSACDAYLTSNGYSGYTPASGGDGINFVMKFFEYDSKVYGAICGTKYYPILVYSSDNCASLTPFAIYPYLTSYEFNYVIDANEIQALSRHGDQASSRLAIKYAYSTDNGSTWTRQDCFNSYDSRPELFYYNDELYFIYNVNYPVSDKYPRKNSRTAILIGKINNHALENVWMKYSNYGLVYPRTLVMFNDIYIAYSNSLLGLMKDNLDNSDESKEQIRWVKLT